MTMILTNTSERQYEIDGMKFEVAEDFKYLGKILSFTSREEK